MNCTLFENTLAAQKEKQTNAVFKGKDKI